MTDPHSNHRILMLAYSGMTQLDLTGPCEVFVRSPELEVVVVAASPEPVRDSNGLRLLPDMDLAQAGQANVLFVPGGPGQVALMEDAATLGWLRGQAAGARWITSVCTGSLVLAAAGLLSGYRATCHWLSLDQLALFGAEPVAGRVVEDRDRMTGAGVTSGLDFALTLTARLFGETRARRVQLSMEYDADPPLADGSLRSAAGADVTALRQTGTAFQETRRAASVRAAAALKERP